MAGRIIGAVVLGAVTRGGTLIGYRVQELHSTKGWRKPFLIGRSHFPFGAIVGAFHKRHNTMPRLSADPGRLMPNRTLTGPVPVRRGREFVHAWQRKQKEKEANVA